MTSVGRWAARLLMLLLVLAVFAAIGYLDRRDREIMRQLHGATGLQITAVEPVLPEHGGGWWLRVKRDSAGK